MYTSVLKSSKGCSSSIACKGYFLIVHYMYLHTCTSFYLGVLGPLLVLERLRRCSCRCRCKWRCTRCSLVSPFGNIHHMYLSMQVVCVLEYHQPPPASASASPLIGLRPALVTSPIFISEGKKKSCGANHHHPSRSEKSRQQHAKDAFHLALLCFAPSSQKPYRHLSPSALVRQQKAKNTK